jgi:hypothetical protein
MHRPTEQQTIIMEARIEAEAERLEREAQQGAYNHFLTCRMAFQLGGDIIEATGLTTLEQLDAIDLDGECVDDNPFWEDVDAPSWDAQDHANDMRLQNAIRELADTFDIDRAF